jgi:hypothetical protein
VGSSSEFHWAVARRTVKVDAVLQVNDLEAFWNAIHLDFQGMLVRVRKLGDASPSAIGARKIFNPVVTRHS